MVHPTHDGSVGHRQAALSHHLHQIPKAELEAQVPPHAQDDDLTLKVATLDCEVAEYLLSFGVDDGSRTCEETRVHTWRS
jgi:hypothetical protein